MPIAEKHPAKVAHDVKACRHMRSHLGSAQLPFKLAYTAREFSRSLNADSQSFVVDIRRHDRSHAGETAKREYFQLYLGTGNDVQILSADRRRRQVLVRVQEPSRKMVVTRREWDRAASKFVERVDETVTPEAVRFVLMGVDDGHLFICELSRPAATVAKAHRSLRPDSLHNRSQTTLKRQGEWFFSSPSEGEQRTVEALWQKHAVEKIPPGDPTTKCLRSVALSGMVRTGSGRAHLASQVVQLGGREYAKGRITHPDHKTKVLNVWMRVQRNTEQTRSLMSGTSWFD